MARDLSFRGDEPDETRRQQPSIDDTPDAEPVVDRPGAEPVGDPVEARPVGDRPDVRPIGDPPDAEPIGDPVDGDRADDDPADLPVVRADADPEPADVPDNLPARQVEQRTYWSEMPRFLVFVGRLEKPEEWEDEEETPAASAADDPVPPDGSWRGDGERFLSPERNADAYEMAAQTREREEAVTGDLRQVVEPYLESGGHLVGLEHSCKGIDRLKEKIADRLEDKPDRTITDVVARIPDAIRYTFQFSTETYVDGYHEVAERMEAQGYEQVKVKNFWDDPEYKGINTRWVTPDGQLFEVQFHTEESFHAKEVVTHAAYERMRNPLTTKQEVEQLDDFQCEVSSWISVPAGVDEIPNHTKEGY